MPVQHLTCPCYQACRFDLPPEIQSRQKLASPGIRQREEKQNEEDSVYRRTDHCGIARSRERDCGEGTVPTGGNQRGDVLYRWKSKFEGMEISEIRRLRLLEDENVRLKKIVAQQALDIDALKAVVSKKW